MFSDDFATRHLDSSAFSIWNKADFLRDFTRRVNVAPAGSRIVATSMGYVHQDPLIMDCMEALTVAAKRGVEVLVLVDAFTFLISDDSQPFGLGPLFYSNDLGSAAQSKAQFREPYLALERLRQAGGRYTVLNQPGRRLSLPIAGRSHIKLYMIDDAVCLGGCNFNSPDDMDLMLGWRDTASATKLHVFANALASTGQTQAVLTTDASFALDDVSQILFDAGRRNHSLILDQALAMIHQASTSIFLTCQFFPGGKIAAALRRARHRGVTVTIVYNHPSKNGHLRALQYVSEAVARLSNPSGFFAHRLPISSPFVHAKLLVTDKSLMLGSHNYVDAGVKLGTAEIALLRHDADLAAKLVGRLE